MVSCGCCFGVVLRGVWVCFGWLGIWWLGCTCRFALLFVNSVVLLPLLVI